MVLNEMSTVYKVLLVSTFFSFPVFMLPVVRRKVSGYVTFHLIVLYWPTFACSVFTALLTCFASGDRTRMPFNPINILVLVVALANVLRISRLLTSKDDLVHAKTRRRKQIVVIVHESPGLAHQPVDDVTILDAMSVFTAQARNALQTALAVVHLQLFGVEPHFHGFTA